MKKTPNLFVRGILVGGGLGILSSSGYFIYYLSETFSKPGSFSGLYIFVLPIMFVLVGGVGASGGALLGCILAPILLLGRKALSSSTEVDGKE